MTRFVSIEILPEDEDGGSFGQNMDESPIERAIRREEEEQRERYYAQFRRTPAQQRARARAIKREEEDFWAEYDSR